MVAPVRLASIATRQSRHGAAAGASVALAGRAGRVAFAVTGGGLAAAALRGEDLASGAPLSQSIKTVP
jgi:hypothetical protein